MWTSVMPQSRITSIWWASSGRLRIGRMGFGERSANGYMRAPLPAARITPTIRPSRLTMRFAGDLAADQLAHDAHGIARAELLAFLEGAAGEADWHYREPGAALREPRGELGFEIETVRRDLHALDQVGGIHLVAG